jgi:hypothetical protein
LPGRDALFDLALFVLASARTTIDEPKRYGPRRLLDTLERLAKLPLEDPRIPDHPLFASIRRKIDERPDLRTSSVVFTDDFKAFLDGMIVDFIDAMQNRQ